VLAWVGFLKPGEGE